VVRNVVRFSGSRQQYLALKYNKITVSELGYGTVYLERWLCLFSSVSIDHCLNNTILSL